MEISDIMRNSLSTPMQIKCIAIDDEPLALSKLGGFIARIQDLQLMKTFDNALDAMMWLKENQADLIFLDIQMEQLTGIQFLEATGTQSKIVVTSAYDQYAVKGFDLNVTDYILKPYSFERFVKAVNKVMEAIALNRNAIEADTAEEGYIFVKTEYRLERVDLDNILYIKGMKDYLRIICTDKKIMTLQSFTRLEESLPPKKFCRVHKSYIVAIDKIKSIERNVIVIADQRIPVSITYRERFFSRIKL
jgi:two-component system LytT family response regulator